jgi:putative addiction module component (TIGR02574 family)
MSVVIERLKSELTKLDSADRADLAFFLIGSLDGAEETDVETEWDAEIDRRVSEIKSGQAVGKPAEQVFAEMRAKYS